MSSPSPESSPPTEPTPSAEPTPPAEPTVAGLLAAAVTAIGGSSRTGQEQMATAVGDAMAAGQHLLVQAGTGTGKSLAYLVPAVLHARDADRPVVVATATIALQRQLVERDLPALLSAVAPQLGRTPEFALLKGRRNYLCLQRVHGGGPEDPGDQGELFDGGAASSGAAAASGPHTPLGREVLRLREWADDTDTGDRDELVPGVSERAWSQMSVSARECIGAARCPFGAECYAEAARARAADADIVVTNHALLALDLLDDRPVLPEHDVVVIDEAHELADRVSGAATAELTVAIVERAASRARRFAGEESGRLEDVADELGAVLETLDAGELRPLSPALGAALAEVRDAARALVGELGDRGADEADLAPRRLARTGVEAVFETAERLASGADADVAWLAVDDRADSGARRELRVAPLRVDGLLRTRLFGSRTVVATSATLVLGGGFDTLARALGLVGGDDDAEWQGIDVGSPFDYPRQGILYVARHLAPPGRDGLAPAFLDELAALVEAAGGRTLGLFSSMRAATAAAEQMRERLDFPVLCQGDDATGLLVRRFAEDPTACLFGTLSLWQGVDVPGASCQLVVIDRLPFPRPDDPLTQARQRAVAEAGGNGFMAVAAARAALLLAQGGGRLIRSTSDRGVVAVLDSRLATARYGSYLRASLPPLWFTTDREVVLGALRRLNAAAGSAPPVP